MVRFIDAFVDGLDLDAAGFERVQPQRTGRPGYDPRDLLKLYIYGYLNRVRSSRKLEVETHRNLEVIWLLRQLRPDFKTIADFRRNNRDAFRQVFREFVTLCRGLDLYGCDMLAVDGTRLKAVNNRQRNYTKAKLVKALARIDDQVDRYLREMDTRDTDAAGVPASDVDLAEKIAALRERRARLEVHRAELAATGQSQISLTDPDARAMHASSRIGVGYNAQIAVDAKHKLIAEQQVHNTVTDFGHLCETADAARRNLGVERIDVVADRGFYKIEDIEDCEAAGITPYVAKQVHGATVRNGFFPKSAFQYDPIADAFTCPGGEALLPRYRAKVRDVEVITYVNRAACRACEPRPKCSRAKFRKVQRYAKEAVLDRMAERLAANPEVMVVRKSTVEHPFGSIKHWMGHRAFLTRRLGNVRAEFSLTALAYNIRRAVNLVGVDSLVRAVAD